MPSYPAHTAVLWGLQEAHLSGQGKDRGNEAGCVRSLERLCPSQNMDFLNLSPMLSAYKRLKDRLGRHWNTSTESQHCCGPSLLSDCSRKSIPVWETWSCQAAIPSTDTSKSPRKSMEMNSLSSAAASPWAKINSLLCMQSMCWHVLYSWQRSASGVTCQSLICLPLINVASSWTPRASSRGLLSLQAREQGALSVLLLHFNTGSSQSSNAKTELDAASPAQPPRAVAPQKTPRQGAATSRGSARRGERGDRQYGMATVLQGSLLVPVLIVLFHAVRFELNRMKAFLATIPAWITHKANSPRVSCSTCL